MLKFGFIRIAAFFATIQIFVVNIYIALDANSHDRLCEKDILCFGSYLAARIPIVLRELVMNVERVRISARNICVCEGKYRPICRLSVFEAESSFALCACAQAVSY